MRVLVLWLILILKGLDDFQPLPFFLPHPVCVMNEIIKNMVKSIMSVMFIFVGGYRAGKSDENCLKQLQLSLTM